ncbi:hypothetical protein N2152v2_008495 [Parachlorella kessleri]
MKAMRQVFKCCVLPKVGAAIPTSAVARKERPPPPRVTLKLQDLEISPPATPGSSVFGSPTAATSVLDRISPGSTATSGSMALSSMDSGRSFALSSMDSGRSMALGSMDSSRFSCLLDDAAMQLFLEHAYDAGRPVTAGGCNEDAIQDVRRLLDVATLFQSDSLRAKCESAAVGLAEAQLEASPAINTTLADASPQPTSPRGAAAEAAPPLLALLSLAHEYGLSQLECHCLPALCKLLATARDRRLTLRSLALLSGPATSALVLMLADLAASLAREGVAAWEYSEPEAEGLVNTCGGLLWQE